jgi:hypothetical protein
MENEDLLSAPLSRAERNGPLDPDACQRLLVDVVYHGIRDLEALNESGRVYVDDDHRALCNSGGFLSGLEELSMFFNGSWFPHICDGFQDITANEILCNIDLGVYDQNP